MIRRLGVALALALLLGTVAAETFHFQIDESTLTCDEGATDYVLHLKEFNLQCIDGIGCDEGGGILGAAAFVADVTFPTAVHIAIHGCQGPLAQYCDQDLLDDVIDVCDSLSDIVTKESGFCSRDHRENRFGLGIPFPPTLIPLGPFSPKEVLVTMTFDDMNYCQAQFSVRLEEGPIASILGYGAPLIGIGVSFLLFTSYAVGCFQKDRRTVDETTLNEQIFPSAERTPGPKTKGSIRIGNRRAKKQPPLTTEVELGPDTGVNLEYRVRLQTLS